VIVAPMPNSSSNSSIQAREVKAVYSSKDGKSIEVTIYDRPRNLLLNFHFHFHLHLDLDLDLNLNLDLHFDLHLNEQIQK
jgi:hypothetical protein